MSELLMVLLVRGRSVLAHRYRLREEERGDVPGWVLVTVMTAGLVMAIWGLAEDQLGQMLKAALSSVKG